ncbi:MAG: type II secretion system F family protein [Armatimonadota bacterium]
MPIFRYEAVDKTGKVVRGAMDASSEQQVARNLAAMGYVPRGIYSTGSSSGTAPSKTTFAKLSGSITASTIPSVGRVPVSVQPRVRASRLAVFFRQLATLVRAGITPFQAFSDLASVTRDRHLRRAVSVIQTDLQAGRSLSSALAGFPELFPADVVALVWCGELSGKLDVALDQVASDLEAEASDERTGRIGWILVKINLLFLILTLPAYNLSNLIRPVLDSSSAVGNEAQNLLYAFWQDVLRAVVYQCLPIVLIIIAAWIVWGWVKRIAMIRRLLDALLLWVPVWGKLHRYRAISRFFRSLEMLSEAAVNPGRAWEAASLTPRNSEVATRLRFAKRDSQVSVPMADLAGVSGVFEPEDLGMIAAGEKAGQLPATFARLAAVYAERAAAQKAAGRALSVSLMIASLIAMSGVLVIMMAKSYFGTMLEFMGS